MKIIKDTLNNILLMNGPNTVRKWADIATQLILNGNAVVIQQAGFEDYAMYAEDIDSYQVLPGVAVGFSGSASELLDVLKNNFFLSSTVVTAVQDVNIVSSIPLDVNILTPVPLDVNITGGTLTPSDSGIVDAGNSTTSALLAGATFTGVAIDVVKYPSVVVSALTDKEGTLQVQFSPDGVNWDSNLSFSVAANTNEVHRVTVTRRYFRVRFVNGAANQGFLRLQTLLGRQQTLTSALNSIIQADADAQVVRPLDFNLMVAENLYENRNATTKEGINFDVDTGSVPEDLWDFGGTYTGFPAAAGIAEINVPGADTGTVFYAYMASATDTNYTFASRAITGAGNYALGHNIYRCNFCYFVASNGTSFNVSAINIRLVATPATVFVSIPIGYSQSYCAAYTVPFGATAYIDRITANIRLAGTGFCDGVFWYRPLGESPRYRFIHEYSSGGLYFDDIDFLIAIPSLTDFVPRITFASANNLVCKISYRLILKRA
jgi:hypothetical protein